MNLPFIPRAIAAIAISIICVPVALAQNAATPVRNIDVTQGRAMQQQGALLLDVREQDEFAEGHAPGSVLIPLGQLQSRAAEIGDFKRNPVVIICRSGRRSALAAGMLQQLGFSSVYNVQGGMLAWEKATLPIVRLRKQALN